MQGKNTHGNVLETTKNEEIQNFRYFLLSMNFVDGFHFASKNFVNSYGINSSLKKQEN